MKLRLHSGQIPGFHSWGEGSVVFSPRTGETYFLDSVASEGVLCLTDGWLDVSAYRAAVAAKLGVDDDETLKQYVDRLVAQFEDAGLVEKGTGE